MVYIVKERIIWNWIRNFLLVKEDPNPDLKRGRKWDPDPKKIVSDPQHCTEVPVPYYLSIKSK
jgi:hypothetical protein